MSNAKKKKPVDLRDNNTSYGVQFCSIELSADDKRKLQSGWAPPLTLEEFLTEALENEYKVGFSNDKRHNAIVISFTCKNEKDPNHNMCLTSRGPDVLGAYYSLVYKIQTYCVDGNFPHQEVLSEDSLWG